MSVVDPPAMQPSQRKRRALTKPIGSVRVRGMWSRGERDGRWYLRAYRNDAGAEVKVWAGRATRAELEAAVHAAMAADAAPAARPVSWVPTTLAELLAWYVDRHDKRQISLDAKRNVRTSSVHLARELGGVDLLHLREHHLEDYRDHMGGASMGYADSTVRLHLETLRTVCRAAVKRGWMRSVPDMPTLAKVPKRKVPDYTPTRAEALAVLEQLHGWPRLAFAIQCYTGMRIQETAILRWSHLQVWSQPEGEVAGVIHLPHVKGAKTGARQIPLRVELLAEFEAWQGEDRGAKTQPLPRLHVQTWLLMLARGLPVMEVARQTGAHPDKVRNARNRWGGVWPRPAGKPRQPEHRILGVSVRTAQGINTHLAEACEALGIPRFTSHAMRRSMADLLARWGVDIATAALLLGMSPEVMMRYYRKPKAQDAVQAMARVEMQAAQPERVASGDNVVPFTRE